MFQTLLNAPAFLYFSQRYSSPVFVPVKGEILHTGNKNNIPVTYRSIQLPIQPITFPIVKAARTVPIPRPLICPKKVLVIKTVTARQDTSKIIFTLE